ncbi:MAG: M3 family oligoendopeptidase [Oscillospiraceae bacterium]|nr:M3 family oligoendopeptidase [Oscillospiraceae bacterium]
MQKFKDLEYKRPSLAALLKNGAKNYKMFKNAEGYPAAREAFLKIHQVIDDFETPYQMAYIRNSMNLKDKFYEKETKFYNTALALIAGAAIGVVKKFLSSPYRTEFEEEFGPQSFKLLEAQMKTNGVKTVVEMIQEDSLARKYKKTTAACSTEFNGEKCNFYGLMKYMQSPDREVRRAAYIEWAKLYEGISTETNGIFDKMVKVRVRKAKKLGFANYIDYAYVNRMRYDYNAADAARFREQVRLHIVPAAAKLYDAQRERLGLEKLKFYDEALFYPEGNPAPSGSKEDIIAAAGKMYAELSPETDEFFKFMAEYELFDLETRQNKQIGGYCTHMLGYKAPFIFANFNGTSADVDVMTHEAGHAFQAYISSRRQELAEYVGSTSEINETHSMSMEHFTYPWMGLFFGEDAERYMKKHLTQSFCTMPYLVAIDEFQEEVYKKPKMPAAGRNAAWKKIEGKYLPWRDYDGNGFFEGGGIWMRQQHVFVYPFYYIEYALAQICAYQYYIRSLENREAAWSDYFRLCEAGGSKGYFELLKTGNLKNPFDDGVVKEVAGDIKALIFTRNI